jgi:hypothetical protein
MHHKPRPQSISIVIAGIVPSFFGDHLSLLSTITPNLRMATAFVQAADGLNVPAGPLQDFTSRRDFAEFYSSSFPVFSLGMHVSESDMRLLVDTANQQACVYLGFDDAELVEMGCVAAIPETCQLYDMTPLKVVQWYHERFSKSGTSSGGDPHWYPIGFLGIVSPDWRKDGVVLVFYDALPGQLQNENVAVRSYRLDPEKIGSALIDFRQGDDDYENIKRSTAQS